MEAAARESMADEMALTALTASKVGAHPESGTEGAAPTSFTLLVQTSIKVVESLTLVLLFTATFNCDEIGFFPKKRHSI